MRSGSEERGRDDADPIRPTVCVRSGGHNDRVEQVGADLSGEPSKMTHTAFIDVAAELHFDGDDPPVATLDDEVDFAL